MNSTRSLHLLLLFVIIVSCSTSENVHIERGVDYNFKIGHPEFYTSAFGFIDEDEGPTLLVRTEIIKNSFLKKKEGDSLAANIELNLQIIDTDNPGHIINNKRFVKKLTRPIDSAPNTASRETLGIEYSIPVEPSRYKVVAIVRDLNTDKELSQETETFIPETKTGGYTLSNIRMFGKKSNKNSWTPINTYDVQGDIDSLRFVFQVISGKSKKQLKLNSELVRYKSDTSIASPMDFANYSLSSIEYKGIDYDETTEVQSNRRILTDYQSVFIEYKFANQQRGNYQFQVTATRGNNDNDQIFKGRSFGIKSANYPGIQNARELARPLAYLMNNDEHEELMEISNPDSLKNRVDRFWLKNIGNRSIARNVIQLYYERVEQANKQFSNFKEGWKTDTGMIYILFGPPYYIDDHLKEMDWFYSYDRTEAEYNYVFEQPKLKNKFYPFYHYVLERHSSYHNIKYRQQQLWLSGNILSIRI